MLNDKNITIEIHPWEPFIPECAKALIMGTFPPGKHRWSMDFYYPNPTNDFWRIMSLIFLGDKDALFDIVTKKFNLEGIKKLTSENHIALNDTAKKAVRLMGNASDKFLEIVEPVDLNALLEKMPECRDIASTGEKAASVIAEITNTHVPKMGEFVIDEKGYRIWRLPSTSRAYPMKIEQKADFYRNFLKKAEILQND